MKLAQVIGGILIALVVAPWVILGTWHGLVGLPFEVNDLKALRDVSGGLSLTGACLLVVGTMIRSGRRTHAW